LEYNRFFKIKTAGLSAERGLKTGPMNPAMMDFQQDIARWNMRKGTLCGTSSTPARENAGTT
jgi:hypothetical protein